MTNVISKLCGEPPSTFVTVGLSHTTEWGHAYSYEEEDQRVSQEKGNFIIFIPHETSLLKVAVHFTETRVRYL